MAIVQIFIFFLGNFKKIDYLCSENPVVWRQGNLKLRWSHEAYDAVCRARPKEKASAEQ